MKIFLSVIGLTALIILVPVDTASADYATAYPWCGSFGGGSAGRDGDSGGENCGFKTYEQCRQFVQPFGTCRNNVWYRPSTVEPQTLPRRKHHTPR